MISQRKVFYRKESDRTLETTRLLMEPLVAGHAAKLFDSFQNDSLRFIGRPESVAKLEEKYRRFKTHGPNDGKQVWLNWAARDKNSDVYVGWFQATIHDDGTTNLSYVVFPPYWRRGYSTEACREMMAHLVEVYVPANFVVEMDRQNAASIAMAEKLGFLRCDTTVADEFRYEMRTEACRPCMTTSPLP